MDPNSPPQPTADPPLAPPIAAGEGASPEGSPPPRASRPWLAALLAIAPLVLSLLYLVGYLYLQSAAAKLLFMTSKMTGVSRLLHRGAPPRGEFFLLVDALTTPLIVLLTWIFLKLFHRRTLASLGLRWPRGSGTALREAWQVPLATIGSLLLWMSALAVLPLQASFRYGGFSAAAVKLPGAPLSSLGVLALLLVAFLVQGGMEEWVLRGYVYQACKERWTVWGAVIASSVFFAALHAGNPGVSNVALFNTFLIGVVLALMVEASGSLWGATLAHGVWNFTIACLLSLPVSGLNIFHLLDLTPNGPLDITGGTYGPEASVVVTAIGLLIIALLLPRVLRQQRATGESA